MAPDQPVRLESLNPACCGEWPYEQDVCLTCAMCASACPAAGVDDYDPRKMVRMVSLGMMDEVARSRWPWICTMCGKCEQSCPMGIDIADITRRLRSCVTASRCPGSWPKASPPPWKPATTCACPRKTLSSSSKMWAKRSPKNQASRDFTCPSTKKGRGCSPPSTTNWSTPHRRPQAVVETLPCRRRRLDRGLGQLGRHQLGLFYRR